MFQYNQNDDQSIFPDRFSLGEFDLLNICTDSCEYKLSIYLLCLPQIIIGLVVVANDFAHGFLVVSVLLG